MLMWTFFIVVVGTLLWSCLIATSGDELGGLVRRIEALLHPTERELMQAYRRMNAD